jgi:ParB family chromosome partitioning protein
MEKIFTLANIEINKIKIKERARKELGDLTDLKNSIQKSGLLNPILVTQDYKLVAGERRLSAMKELNYETIEARITPEIQQSELMIMELMENVARKDFTWIEEITLKSKLHHYWVDQAKAENKTHGYRATGKKLNCSIGTLSTDLVLAEALKSFPNLKTCETKAKAKNMYKKMGDQAEAIQSMQNLSESEQQRLQAMISGDISSFTKDIKIKTNLPKAHHQDDSPDLTDIQERSTSEHQEETIVTKKKKKEVAYSIEDYDTFLSKIPSNSTGFIELDPPYAIDFNTNYGKVSNIKSKAKDWTVEKLYNFYNLTLPILFDKLLDSSWILCWSGKEHWIEANKYAEKAGFKIQPPGIWAKLGGSTNSPKTNMTSNYEMFLLFRKGNATFNTKSFPSVINFESAPASQRIHQWEKPLVMYEYLMEVFGKANSIFLSPFAGSGNSLIAATEANMLAMGCDEQQKYIYEFHKKFNDKFNSDCD